MADAFDLLEEARWEVEGTRRALERYRKAAEAVDPASLPSGQRLLREVVPPLTAKLEALKTEGFELLTRQRKKVEWAAPIQLLDAPTMAVITIARALWAGENPMARSSSIASVSEDIAQASQTEVTYRRWIEEQEASNLEARKARDWTKPNLLRAFRERYPTADRKTWRRFSRKLEGLEKEVWPKEVAIHYGGALLKALLEAAPDKFELITQQVAGGKTRNHIAISRETLEVMRDVEARAEVARPMLMPMLIPPIPWRYE